MRYEITAIPQGEKENGWKLSRPFRAAGISKGEPLRSPMSWTGEGRPFGPEKLASHQLAAGLPAVRHGNGKGPKSLDNIGRVVAQIRGRQCDPMGQPTENRQRFHAEPKVT